MVSVAVAGAFAAAGGTTATTGGAFLAAGLGLAGSLVDQLYTIPALSGEPDSISFNTDYGSLRGAQGDELTPVPRCLGELNRVPGILVWASEPRARRDEVERGGAFGKRGETTVETSWKQNFAIAVAGNNLETVTRILADGSPVYDTRPPAVARITLNDDSLNNGGLINYSRLFFTRADDSANTSIADLWNMRLESLPEVGELTITNMQIVTRPLSDENPWEMNRRTRVFMTGAHGIPVGSSVQVNFPDEVITAIARRPPVGMETNPVGLSAHDAVTPKNGYWYWAEVPDEPGAEAFLDVLMDDSYYLDTRNALEEGVPPVISPEDTAQFIPQNSLYYSNGNLISPPLLDVTFTVPSGARMLIDRQLGRPNIRIPGLSQFDVGRPATLQNITRGLRWEQPGFEVVSSIARPNGIDQLTIDINDAWSSPTNQFRGPWPFPPRFSLFDGPQFTGQGDLIVQLFSTDGTFNRDPLGSPLPFEIATGDVIQVEQQRVLDEVVDQWEFPSEGVDVRFQDRSAIIQNEVSADELPAYRGLFLVAADEFNNSSSSSRLPNVEAFVVEERQKPLSQALVDIGEEWGVSVAPRTGTAILPGMTWAGRMTAKDLFQGLSVAYDLVGKEENYGDFQLGFRLARDGALGTDEFDLDDRNLNPDLDGVFIPFDDGQRIRLIGDDISSRPSELTIGFFDSEDDLNRGAVTQRLSTVPDGNQESTIQLPLAMNSAQAREIARRMMRSLHNWTACEFQLPGGGSVFNSIHENDYVHVTVRERYTYRGEPRLYERRLRILMSRIEEGTDLVLRCEGKITSYDSPGVNTGIAQATEPGAFSHMLTDAPVEGSAFGDEGFQDTKLQVASATTGAGSMDVHVFDDVRFRFADEDKTGYYVAATALSGGTRPGKPTVFRSVDGEQTWKPIGQVDPATSGFVDGVPPPSGANPNIHELLTTGTVVELFGDGEIFSVGSLRRSLGENMALIGRGANAEVVQFDEVTEEPEPDRFRIGGLTRALKGTAVVKHRTRARFLVLDDKVPFFEVPRELMGVTHHIRVVPPGRTVNDVRSQSIDVPAYVGPSEPWGWPIGFATQDFSGGLISTIDFENHGAFTMVNFAEPVSAYDFEVRRISYQIRALTMASVTNVQLMRGNTVLWTSPDLSLAGGLAINSGTIDVSGLTINSGESFRLRVIGDKDFGTWTMKAAVVGRCEFPPN
ncbi:MAG: phage tail protein [Planctomycetota bacterium]